MPQNHKKLKKIKFTPQEIEKLKAIGKRIRAILDGLPTPIIQPEPFEMDSLTMEMMELWDEEAERLENSLNKLIK